MKKMKRALSLLITAAMLIGMFVVPTGAATNFTDAELIENTEAVQITSGIGLFAGTTDGRFAPKATVTRAQMATIIVKMLRGNEFNADAFKGVGVNPFPDTASFEGGWAEGYINACSQLGVVAGYGDGTFKPGRELTTAEAITMIINALGVDPGPGDWPTNYMAKAEAMKLYGDLEVRPATNDPLNRDQLAVIVWEGMKYSPAGNNGYSATIDGKVFTFETLAEALDVVGVANAGAISEVIGEDSLANKVYEIKVASGWITGNTATGEDCTVLTLANGEEACYDISTGVDMLGHYVTIYYKEQFKNEEEPGKAYTIVDESTVVTVKEAISTSKKYKEVFGKSIDVAGDGLLLSADYTITEKLNNDLDEAVAGKGYTAGSRAPKGTYIIADGAIVAYIDPVTVYASYISDIGTLEGEETISIAGMSISNAEGDDMVVEYAGMKIGDYVTYRVVQGVYVLDPVTAVTGFVTKTSKTEEYGSSYDTITLDGQNYLAFSGTNQLGNKLETRLSQVEYGQMYSLYITGDGKYVGFEKPSGGVSMDKTVYLLGSFIVREKDQYGQVKWYSKARGIDMSGDEVILLQGSVRDDGVLNGNGQPVYDSALDTVDQLGTMATVLAGFYTVEDSTDKDAKKEGIQVLTPFGASYSPDTPTYALKPSSTSTVFTGSNTVATAEGVPAIGTAGMKFFVLGGSLTDSAPLSVTTGIPNAFYPTTEQAASSYMLVTRQPSGAMSNINIWIYRSDEKTGKQVPFYATQEQIDAPGRTVDGTVYTVYSASTGKEMDLIIDPDSNVTLSRPGMYFATQDGDGITFAIGQVDVTETPNFTDGKAQVVDNIGFWGLTNNRLRGERLASTAGGSGKKIDMVNSWNNGAGGASVVDLRTEEEIKASGVGKITSLSQMSTLRENDPSMMIVYSLYMEDNSSGNSGAVKTVFITRVVRNTVGMNSVVYAMKDPVPGDEMMVVRSLSATMGDRVDVNFEVCRNGGPGFYRFCVDADGKLCLIPYDTKAVSTGSYGMYAMHDELIGVEKIDASTLQLTTSNAAHSGCVYNCTDAGVEPLKEFVITAATTTILDVDGKTIPFGEFYDLFLNNGLVINYYCDTPVNNANSTGRDTSAELIVISSRTEVPVSCDGSCRNGTPVNSASDITGSGSYYLNADISGLTISSGTIDLCLNGHSIDGALLVNGGSLSLTNCDGRKGGQISGAVTVNGGTFTMEHAVTAKAGATVASGANFVMEGGTVTGGTSGGVVNNGTFTMKDGKISDNTASSNGGGIYNTGTVTISGGSITGNKTTAAFGGGVYVAGGTVTLTGGVISGNSATGSNPKGVGVYVANGTFNMNGGTISGHTTTSTGAGVQVNGGTFNMGGGTITGNTSGTYGGGVCIQTGTFAMTGGTIAGNANTNTPNGGVDVANGYYGGAGGTVTISGGTIGTEGSTTRNLMVNNNTVTIKGSAVVNGPVVTTGSGAKATLNIQGGTINGNVVNSDAPGSGFITAAANTQTADCVTVITGGTINGSVTNMTDAHDGGKPRGNNSVTISGGTIGGDVTDATISGGTIGGDVTDATINGGTFNGVVNESSFGGGTISGSWTVGTNVSISGGTFLGKTAADLTNASIPEGYDKVEDSAGVTVQYAYAAFDAAEQHSKHGIAVTAGDTLYGGANYYLNSDLTGGITVEGSGELTLCLNGHTISTGDANAITVSGSVTLQLCNCSAVSGNVQGGGTGSGMRINGGTVNMYKNVHFDNGVYGDANPVRVVGATSAFVMHDGVISGNTTAVSGGGVAVISGSTFTMNNGTISGNVTTSTAKSTGGGGVFVQSSTFNLYDGKIVCNEAKTAENPGGGGGVHSAGSTFTMHGGVIAGNTCGHDGGGVWSSGGTFEMKGGVIGGDTMATTGNLSEFTGNRSNTVYTYNGGGGVAIAAGTFKMSGGEIKGNISANTVNDGLWLAGNTNLTITGGSVINNAQSDGNDFRPSSTNASNTATVSGGEFGKMTVASGSKLKITGGTFGSDPSAYVASTHQATQSGGVWTVSAK